MDLKSLLEDDNFLIGMGLLSAGSKGQSIGEAGLTSIKDAAAIKKSFAGTPKKLKQFLILLLVKVSLQQNHK